MHILPPSWEQEGSVLSSNPNLDYSSSAFVSYPSSFVLSIPANLPLDAAAPLLCAGITVYSPIMHYGMNEPGKTLGVVGLGGENRRMEKAVVARNETVESLIGKWCSVYSQTMMSHKTNTNYGGIYEVYGTYRK